MKTIFKFALTTVLLLALSCTQESVTDGTTEDLTATSAKGKKHAVPIKNSLESDPRTDLPPLTCTPSDFPPAGGGAVFYSTTSHLGKVHGTTINTSCTYNTDGTLTITSDDTTYAANGDILKTEGEITITFPTDPNDPIATITGGSNIVPGGTGRFVNATGRFDYHDMVVNLLTGHESHTSTGWIIY
ncbi:MAG: hypothetical protein WBN52_08365 [Eudoraea sp.]|uniref:hypothetical protein n=1 Tax=Eudoraea sp. TaxID=1979955 RepID=UPI003C78DC23